MVKQKRLIICSICKTEQYHQSYNACFKCVNKTPQAIENKKRWKQNHKEKYKESERLRKQQPHNKLKSSILRKKYYENNKEKELSQHKIWEQNNRDKRVIINQRRRANLNKVIHLFTYDEWQEKLLQTNGYCPLCNKLIGINNLTLDHIVPISKVAKGFEYTIKDIQPLCYSCNSSKKDKI